MVEPDGTESSLDRIYSNIRWTSNPDGDKKSVTITVAGRTYTIPVPEDLNDDPTATKLKALISSFLADQNIPIEKPKDPVNPIPYLMKNVSPTDLRKNIKEIADILLEEGTLDTFVTDVKDALENTTDHDRYAIISAFSTIQPNERAEIAKAVAPLIGKIDDPESFIALVEKMQPDSREDVCKILVSIYAKSTHISFDEVKSEIEKINNANQASLIDVIPLAHTYLEHVTDSTKRSEFFHVLSTVEPDQRKIVCDELLPFLNDINWVKAVTLVKYYTDAKNPVLLVLHEIFKRKLLAQLFTFSGTSKLNDGFSEIPLEGALIKATHNLLEKDVNAFFGASKEATVLSNALNHTHIKKRVDEKGMVALYGSWITINEGHAIGALIFKDQNGNYILARCNKGDQGPLTGIRFDKIGNPNNLDEWAAKFSNMPNPDWFLDPKLLALEPCAIEPILQRQQKMGNCTVANFNSLERAVLYAIDLQNGIDDATARTNSKIRHAERAHYSAMTHLEDYLNGYKNSRQGIHYQFVGSFFVKRSSKGTGPREQERLARLERWLYQANFTENEFTELQKGITSAFDKGLTYTSDPKARDEAIGITNRAQVLIKGNKHNEAIAFLDEYLKKPNDNYAKLSENLNRMESELKNKSS